MPLPAIALFQPDIPQNVGAMMRLCACLNFPLHVIEPTTFIWKESEFRRAGMDYMEHVDLTRHTSWNAFLEATAGRRIVLMTTKGAKPLYTVSFRPDDIILMGSESAGAPAYVHDRADARIFIPMRQGVRSMNIVTAAAIAGGEALRQIEYNQILGNP